MHVARFALLLFVLPACGNSDSAALVDTTEPQETANEGDVDGADESSPNDIEPDSTPSCPDAPCTVAGAKRCDGESVEVCDDFNDDGCLEWGGSVACGLGESCSNGRCEVGCTDECATAGDKRCDGNGVAICGDTDADDCLEWGTVSACEPGSSCSNGTCSETCENECTSVGQKACDSGGNVITCGDTDPDACLEWGSPVPCAGGAVCDAGTCGTSSSPKVVINEIVVDSAGSPDTDSFVELRGPPGTDLAGWTLVGINGNGGAAYATIVLDGAIPSDGLFVITHPLATPALFAAADMRDAKVDFQNGPDSVQLKMGATIVDALGYGTFGDSAVFAGEGTPASAPRLGESLTRDADGSDTDDNAADFIIAAPSPGVAGPGEPVGDPCLGIGEEGCCTADGSATFYCSGGALRSKRCDDSACVFNGLTGDESCEEDVPSNTLSLESRRLCPANVPDVCADACADGARCRIECGVACPCGPTAGFTPLVMSSAHWNDGSKTTVVLIDKAQSPTVCQLADTFDNAPATAAKAYRITFDPRISGVERCRTPEVRTLEYTEWNANGTTVVRDFSMNVAALGSDETDGCHLLVEAVFKGGNVINLDFTVPWGAGVKCGDLP